MPFMFDSATINAIISALTAITSYDEGKLIWQITDLIDEVGCFTFVSIFLADKNKEFIVMKSGSGVAGKKMTERQHKLPVHADRKPLHPVANAFYLNEIQLHDYYQSYYSPDIAESDWQLAFPLRINNQPIGVLEVEGSQRVSFQVEDTYEFQKVADEVSSLLVKYDLI
jgi:hypothetical protein